MPVARDQVATECDLPVGHLQCGAVTRCHPSVCRLRSGYLLSSGRGARLPGADDQLASANYLAVAHLGGDANDGRNDNIFLAAPVQLEVLQKHVPGIVSRHVGGLAVKAYAVLWLLKHMQFVAFPV